MSATQSARALPILLLLALGSAGATRTGDEDFGAEVSGVFYAFADRIVQIITPANASVIRNLTTDSQGAPLTNVGASGGSSNTSRTWNDAAFVEDASLNLRYVAVNEGDVYGNGSSLYSYCSVIDATQQKFVARIRVGPRPVHLYSVNQTNTLWSHSDAEGTFYVIPVNTSQNLNVSKTVKAYTNSPGHGKLVVNNALYPIGYGTNVAEPIIPKFNLSSATNIANLRYNGSLPDPTVCTGTHTIVYSRVNQHLFIECVDGTGVLEWNTANDSFVHLHSNAPGVVTGSPADDMIFVGNKGGSNATLIRPGANGRTSTVFAVLQVPYNPDYPAFYSNSSSETQQGNFTAYTIYFPLTRNTNINNIRAASNNVTTLQYMEMPSDCRYGNASSSLMTASVGDEDEGSGQALQLALNSTGGVATPACGACAPGFNTSDASQFNASLSGFGILNLATFNTGPSNTTTSLLAAGATLPRPDRSTGANQCSFSTEAYRTVRRGGPYVATVADFPQPSIYIVDASAATPVVSGVALTAKSPSKLVWVPSSVD